MEATQVLPPPPRDQTSEALDVLSERVDRMALGFEDMGRNQEMLIYDLRVHLGFPLHDYAFYYP